MDNSFELPVTYNGNNYLFKGALVTYGYSYKITMDVFDCPIHFEPDEEGAYRALTDAETIRQHTTITPGLLQAIAETLHEALQ